jgi:hypothetical protein
MRKLFTTLAVGSLLIACNNNGETVESKKDSTTVISADSTASEQNNNTAAPESRNLETDTTVIGEDTSANMRKPYQKP